MRKAEAEAAAREAQDAQARRRDELQRRVKLLEAAGFPSTLGTLDRTSVATAHGQAYCRLALACSLHPRLCSDSADDLVPEPELLQRVGLHLLEQATAQRYEEHTEIRTRVSTILESGIPEVHAASEALHSIRVQDVHEIKNMSRLPASCVPVCEAVCVLMGVDCQMIGDP